MALIQCPECKREISDQAPTCPNCGFAINGRPITIQKTNKSWKITGLAGGILIFLGLAYISSNVGLGTTLLIFGFVILFCAKIGAWWTNG